MKIASVNCGTISSNLTQVIQEPKGRRPKKLNSDWNVFKFDLNYNLFENIYQERPSSRLWNKFQ